jgi:hypothetical protein
MADPSCSGSPVKPGNAPGGKPNYAVRLPLMLKPSKALPRKGERGGEPSAGETGWDERNASWLED